jgi:hypothetical protein
MYKLRVGLLLASAGLSAISVSGATLYAVAAQTNDSGYYAFGTLDSTTGVFSQITTLSYPSLYGMGFTPDGTMYATDQANPLGGVDQVDPATGGLTSLGTLGIDSPTGSTVGPDGLIYAVSSDTNAVFYTIDPATLAVNPIGSPFIFSSDGLAVFASGPCTDGICFYTDAAGTGTDGADTLWAVDPVTGAATAIGTGFGTEAGTGIQIFAGANANGTVYGVSGDDDSNLYTINLTTGLATAAATITGNGAQDAGWTALAYDDPPVPEPSTDLLVGLGLGLAGLASAVRRRRRIAPAAERLDCVTHS